MTLIREMSASERPINRAHAYGVKALATAELIQLITRCPDLDTGYAVRKISPSLADLFRLSIEELSNIPHIGPGAAMSLKAALELGRRWMIENPVERPQIQSPADGANLVMQDMMNLDHEELRIIILDIKFRVIEIETLYKCTLNMGTVRICEVFKTAIKRNAAAIIIVHNHPSGDPTPSPEDVRVTDRLRQAADLMEIELIDHLVIGHKQYISMKARGLGF